VFFSYCSNSAGAAIIAPSRGCGEAAKYLESALERACTEQESQILVRPEMQTDIHVNLSFQILHASWKWNGWTKFVRCSPFSGPGVVMYVGRDSLTANLAGTSKTYPKNYKYFGWGVIIVYYDNIIFTLRKLQRSRIFEVFWKVTPCWLVNSYRRFGGAYALYLQEQQSKNVTGYVSLLFQNSRWPAVWRASPDKCYCYLYCSPFICRKSDQVRKNKRK
jgi:hypothetical protein